MQHQSIVRSTQTTMFKLIVCAVLAVAAAEPGVYLASQAPVTTYISPASATISKVASSVVHPSPLVYSSPYTYTHFIKKRSAPFTYFAPATYSAVSPYVATTYAARAPIVAASPYVAPAHVVAHPLAHLIKKRSVSLGYVAPSSYLTPSTYFGGPLATAYTTPYVHTAPIVSTAALPVAAHLIKKRSAPVLATTYAAPYTTLHSGVVSHHTLHGAPLITSYSTPLAYSSPITTHLI